MNQPEIKVVNDRQTLTLIQDGAVVFMQAEDLSMQPTYRAILINDQLAYFISSRNGQVISEHPGLMVIVDSFLSLFSVER
jgi:hypothetical protein